MVIRPIDGFKKLLNEAAPSAAANPTPVFSCVMSS